MTSFDTSNDKGDEDDEKSNTALIVIIIVVIIIVVVLVAICIFCMIKKKQSKANQVSTINVELGPSSGSGSRSGAATANNSSAVPMDSLESQDREKGKSGKETERQLVDTDF